METIRSPYGYIFIIICMEYDYLVYQKKEKSANSILSVSGKRLFSRIPFGNSLRGSFTVEMSFIMPIILMLLMSSMLAVFYYHDKNVLNGAAYEVAVVGAGKVTFDEETDSDEIIALCRERLRGKCILFAGVQVDAQIGKDEVIVTAKATRKKFQLNIEQSAPVTRPEKQIRMIQNAKGVFDGTQNND